MKNILFLNLLNCLSSYTYISNEYQSITIQNVNLDQYVSLVDNYSFDMSIKEFLTILEQWKQQNNILTNLKEFNFIVNPNVENVILQKYELQHDLGLLFCYFELTLNDKTTQRQKLSIELNQFNVVVQNPKQINLTINDFYNQLETCDNKFNFLINHGFSFGKSNNLELKPNSFKINKDQNIVSFEYLNYVNNGINVYHHININLNNTQFLKPTTSTKLDTGSIVGICLSVISLVTIISCTITVIVKKKKNKLKGN